MSVPGGLPEWTGEVISDSEEERLRQANEVGRLGNKQEDVIIISSSEDSEGGNVPCKASRLPRTPVKGQKTHGKLLHSARRRIIESSDDDSAAEVLELSDEASPSRGGVDLSGNSYTGRTNNDEAIMIFDEPRGSRTPWRLKTKGNGRGQKQGVQKALVDTPSDEPHQTPLSKQTMPRNIASTPAAQGTPVKTGKASTRPSKKQKTELEQKQRRDYAEELFADLNRTIFKNGLPADTKLNWNNRLLTTAGRAKWHRSRDGVQTSEIELAEKILDREERIRNTLSHEMCHLATWIIDQEVKEHHGKFFKKWASRVERKRPEIEVSIKHNYEISYPYEWKCQKCAKIYGRFSKSIRPAECVCGACKEGALIPLFVSKQPARVHKSSRLAAAKPQDSPRAISSRPPENLDLITIDDLSGDESDTDSLSSDIEILAINMASTTLAE